MRERYDLTFWQNSASIHQAPLMAALAADGLRVRVVVPNASNPARRIMGWQPPDYGAATICVTDDLSSIRSLAETARLDHAHVFTGLGSNQGVSTAFRTLASGPRGHLSVMTESWDPRGARGTLRRVRFTGRALRWRRHVDSVLAMGRLAASQFTSAGIPAERVAQFIYSVSEYDGPTGPEATDIREVAFVGSLEEHKNPLLLLQAMSSLDAVRLTLVGSGRLRSEVLQAASQLGMADCVRVIDRLENTAVRELVARSDLLVLPSRYDGWGAVTNEALMVGTPAVVSDGAGSSLLVADSDRGRVFRSGDVSSLTMAVNEELTVEPASTDRRRRIRDWSRASISPQAVASYLRRFLLDGVRTNPPWLVDKVIG
ncbi:glycosyltransferase [Georgenia sp. H159]|uniref:glycosyltransferase n=1 Tax=Georgenia sp. H159 TaxID=3076115 RepID=UPI002D783EFD|nr:glycosyltransferase [Georgenia sp. H159]